MVSSLPKITGKFGQTNRGKSASSNFRGGGGKISSFGSATGIPD